MTRSRLASKSEELERRNKEVEAIELTDEEIRRAILAAKITKWNHEQNKDYWDELEKKKP